MNQCKKMGLYLHIPFCIKKCDYCDFLSSTADSKTMECYTKALIREIELSREKMRQYLVDTVFIGGGTPSVLKGKVIEEIMTALRENAPISKNAEITIECNPGTIDAEKLYSYKKAGINRISFGLQSAHDKELKNIGRIHTYEQFLDSYHMAEKTGFENINIDLMSGLPGQSLKSYQETLERVIELNPPHISAYSLIVEEGTKMFQRVEHAMAEGRIILPMEEEERNMYYLTKELLQKAGYERYEISNYAKAGYACRHNAGYWKRKEYLGFGIGASSLYQEERYKNVDDIGLYMNVLLGKDKTYDREETAMSDRDILAEIEENQQKLSIKEQMEEFMFLGLRMMEGVSVQEFQEKFNKPYADIYGRITERFVEQKLLEWKKKYIRLTERGIDLSNYVMAEFLF